MKKTLVLSTVAAFIVALVLVGGSAVAAPYVKGDAPNIAKEQQETTVHPASSSCETKSSCCKDSKAESCPMMKGKDAKAGACPMMKDGKSAKSAASCPAGAKAAPTK